jgi:hypothetical protein
MADARFILANRQDINSIYPLVNRLNHNISLSSTNSHPIRIS